MKAVVRADASAAIGSGHLSRCLTLAGALRRSGVLATFALHAPDEAARRWVTREGHALVELSSPDDPGELLAGAPGAAIAIVDGYRFGPEYADALRADERVVCVIDDLASAPVRADVVVNGNFYAEELAYDVRAGTRLLLGPAYALVREEFLLARSARTARTPLAAERPRILVTMGGADPAGVTERVLESLEELPPARIRVIVGGANPRAGAIRELAARSRHHEAEVLVDVRDMGVHMAWCDVAVSAAGSTCLELSCVGVAAAVLVVAENQRLVGEALARRGLMTKMDGPESVARTLSQLLADEPCRRAMESAQRASVDGSGSERVAAELVGAFGRLTGRG